jgi:hypothetical protein
MRPSDLGGEEGWGVPAGALLPSSGVATRWFLLTILTGSYGAGAFGMLGISPLSPSLVEGFGLTRLQVALMAPGGAGTLAFLTGAGPYGWVGVFFVMSAELGGPRGPA